MEFCLNFALIFVGLLGPVSPQLSGLYTGPYFSLYTAGNVSVREGDIAHLPCRVHQVKNHTVSWIRNRDSAILSIDSDTIIHDKRISVIQTRVRGDYVLAISSVRPRDSGRYECQISMSKKLSMFVQLTVLVPSLGMEGPLAVFTQSGSSVQLQCTLAHARDPEAAIAWFKNDVEVSPSSEDTKIENFGRAHNLTSRLTITNVGQERHGVYVCSSQRLRSENLTLHVIDAKEQGLRTNGVDPITTFYNKLMLVARAIMAFQYFNLVAFKL